jgi:hypothetical protein
VVTLALMKKSKDQVLARKSGHTLPLLPHCSLLLLGDSQVKKPAADKNGRLAFLNKNLNLPRKSQSGTSAR